MDRIGGYVGILASEGHFNNDKIVDVFQIITNLFLCMFGAAIVDDQISGSSNRDLVCNMTRQDELAIVPSNFDLFEVNIPYAVGKPVKYIPSFP